MRDRPLPDGRLRVGILSQWYDPEPGGAAIPAALARELASRGHDVSVITGFPNYPIGRVYPGFRMKARLDTESDGIRTRRVALYPSHDGSVRGRLLNYGSFAATATTIGIPALRQVDVLWVYNSPASIAVPMWASRLVLRIPHVLHIMDLWPDSILETSFGRSTAGLTTVQHALNAWCNAMYRHAAAIAYITPGIGDELVRRGVSRAKLHYAPVWADALAAEPAQSAERSAWESEGDELLLLYAGTLGAAQGLDVVLDTLDLLRNKCRITFLVAGTGTERDSLEAKAQYLGLHNVHFLGQVPREDIGNVMASADLHLVVLKDTPLSRITLPSKIQTTLACGRPFLAIVGGDAAEVARHSGAGIVAEPGNVESIASALLRAAALGKAQLSDMGLEGKRYYEAEFSLAKGVDRIETILQEAARR